MFEDFEDEFCGGPFWNYTKLWNIEKPDFTGCFQKTICSWVPLAVVVFFSLFELPGYFSSRNKNRNIRFNWYNLLKLIATLCLVAVNIGQIVYFGIANGDDELFTRDMVGTI